MLEGTSKHFDGWASSTYTALYEKGKGGHDHEGFTDAWRIKDRNSCGTNRPGLKGTDDWDRTAVSG
jgi:hypothetical protein